MYSCYYLMGNDIFFSDMEMDMFKLGKVVFIIKKEHTHTHTHTLVCVCVHERTS